MTEPTEQLAARVAGLMGYKPVKYASGYYEDRFGHTHKQLHTPAEVFRLMCEFDVWPFDTGTGYMEIYLDGDLVVNHPHDSTPESIQQAATHAVLMAVEQILKEKQA